MCVKEFLGYNCGHYSTPYLRQCPITSSNPTFPACKFPAERPIFTNENCHPCARVLWNIKVLAEEEAHHERHRRGDCDCSTIFDSEERERRLRPRSGKGKGKEKEVVHVGENMGPDTREGMPIPTSPLAGNIFRAPCLRDMLYYIFEDLRQIKTN